MKRKIIILLILTIVLTGCKKSVKKIMVTQGDYGDLEKRIEVSAKNYVNDNRPNSNKILIKDLIEDGYMDASVLTINGDKCAGYVIVDGINIKSYIICGSYQTEGFNDVHEAEEQNVEVNKISVLYHTDKIRLVQKSENLTYEMDRYELIVKLNPSDVGIKEPTEDDICLSVDVSGLGVGSHDAKISSCNNFDVDIIPLVITLDIREQ